MLGLIIDEETRILYKNKPLKDEILHGSVGLSVLRHLDKEDATLLIKSEKEEDLVAIDIAMSPLKINRGGKYHLILKALPRIRGKREKHQRPYSAIMLAPVKGRVYSVEYNTMALPKGGHPLCATMLPLKESTPGYISFFDNKRDLELIIKYAPAENKKIAR